MTGSVTEPLAPPAARTALSHWVVRLLDELLFAPQDDEPVEVAVDRLVTPEFTDTIDGVTLGHPAFVEHVRTMRATVATGRVVPLEGVREGRSFAHRHLVDLHRTDGSQQRLLVLMFGTTAPDGRIERLDELTLDVTSDATDRG